MLHYGDVGAKSLCCKPALDKLSLLISKINTSFQALQQYLFLLHELGVGAVVDDILPKAWSREN